MGGIRKFEKKIKKYSGEINPLGIHRNIRGCVLEVNSEGLGWTAILLEAVENGGIGFEIRDIGTSAHLY